MLMGAEGSALLRHMATDRTPDHRHASCRHNPCEAGGQQDLQAEAGEGGVEAANQTPEHATGGLTPGTHVSSHTGARESRSHARGWGPAGTPPGMHNSGEWTEAPRTGARSVKTVTAREASETDAPAAD